MDPESLGMGMATRPCLVNPGPIGMGMATLMRLVDPEPIGMAIPTVPLATMGSLATGSHCLAKETSSDLVGIVPSCMPDHSTIPAGVRSRQDARGKAGQQDQGQGATILIFWNFRSLKSKNIIFRDFFEQLTFRFY